LNRATVRQSESAFERQQRAELDIMTLSWIPNAVTLLRIAAAPIVGWLVWAFLTHNFSASPRFRSAIYWSCAFVQSAQM